MIKRWMYRDAKWFQFWRPQSGLAGGLIFSSVVLLAVFIIVI